MRTLRPLPGPSGIPPPGAAFGLALGQGLVGGVGNFVQGYQASKAAQIQAAMQQARMAAEQARFNRTDETERYKANLTYDAAAARNKEDARHQAEMEYAQRLEEWKKGMEPYQKAPGFDYERRVAPLMTQWFDPKTRQQAELAMDPHRKAYAEYAAKYEKEQERAKFRRAGARATAAADDREYYDRVNKVQETIRGFQNDKNIISLNGPAWERDAFVQAAGVLDDVTRRSIRERRPLTDAEQIRIADAIFQNMKRGAGPALTPENEATYRQQAIDRAEYMLQKLPVYGY